MASPTPAFAPVAPQIPFNAPKVGRNSSPEKMAAAAKQFESSMISSMLKPMFDSLSTAAPFGGGEAESQFRSFLVDAIAKQVTKAGGLHLSGAIQKELVRMQGGAQ
jgi:Rod binding domain-containing protein